MTVKRSLRIKQLKKKRPRRRRSTVQAALTFDSLEQRRMLATLTVSNSSDLVNGNTSSLLTLNADDGGDGISLREAITALDNFPSANNTICFDRSVFTGGDDSLIRLTQGPLMITSGLRIDAIEVGGVVITGDANGDDVTVSGTNITDVSASFGGSSGASSDLLNDNSQVLRNTSPSEVTLAGLTITGGRTVQNGFDGGGISSSGGNLSLIASTVSGNSTAGIGADGGGIRMFSGFLNLTDSTVSNNSTTGTFLSGGIGGVGGGIRAASNLTLVNSTVSGNSAGSGGGGIYAESATRILNSTISSNSTSGNGGGLNLTGILELRQSTVANNSSANNGGGVYAVNDSDDLVLTVRNSIVAGNTAARSGNDFVRDPDGETSISLSLIGDSTGLNSILAVGSNISDVPARLGPLADNGGRTLTHALLPGSPAIDAAGSVLASDLPTDQRGLLFVRRVNDPAAPGAGVVDIGSFELQTLNPVVVVDNRVDENDGDVSAGNLSLREAIDLTNDNLGANTITFDPSVFNGGSNSLIRLTLGELVISETVTIDASGATDVTITGDAIGNDTIQFGTFITDLAANSSSRLDDNSRVLNFRNVTGDLTLNELTITGGSLSGSGAGINFSGNALTLTNSKVSGNSASFNTNFSHDGGGIRASSGDVFLVSSTVSDNRAVGRGGGISARNDVYLTDSAVSGNETRIIGSRGGGIYTQGRRFLDQEYG